MGIRVELACESERGEPAAAAAAATVHATRQQVAFGCGTDSSTEHVCDRGDDQLLVWAQRG